MKFFCDKMKINTHSMYPPKYKVMYGIKMVEYMIGDVCIDNIETDINALDISQVPILPPIISRHKGRPKKGDTPGKKEIASLIIEEQPLNARLVVREGITVEVVPMLQMGWDQR